MISGSLMKVESIAECPLAAFSNTFDLHYAIVGLEKQFLVFLRVAYEDRFYCVFFKLTLQKANAPRINPVCTNEPFLKAAYSVTMSIFRKIFFSF